jgi:xanthine dehydrogenase YagT iron-sulfur-binding subunit
MDKDQKVDLTEKDNSKSTRREFFQYASAFSAGLAITSYVSAKTLPLDKLKFSPPGSLTVSMIINGKKRTLEIDSRLTLLDALREELKLTGTKKGCDRGQCGACTVLVEGRRINSCLTLAALCDGAHVTTIEGLGSVEKLHPMQASFLKHDAFQCGYCTPGQICSAVGLIKEGHAKNDAGIRELMSGNICRCGAYQNILDAIKEVQGTI